MGNKNSGNRKARGTIGHKGGSGRIPMPEEKRLRHPVQFAVNDDLWNKILKATELSGAESCQSFLRQHLNESLTNYECTTSEKST
jgi:hypothetical protein